MVDFTDFNAALQAKLDAVTGSTPTKDFLLLGKTVEATIGNATVSDVNDAGATQVAAVNSAGTTQTGAVNTAGTTQVSAVNSAGTTQVAAVNAAGSTQVGAVNSAGAAQIAAVNAAGDAKIDEIEGMVGAGDVVGPASATNNRLVAFDGTTGKQIKDSGVLISEVAPLASPTFTGTPTAPTAAATTNTTQIATTAMVQSAIANYVAAQDVEVFKGVIDCSANPNYPAADAGHVYRVSVAGKIGGASGVNVEVNDRLECVVDSSASGNHATVGANWMISQVNIDGAVVGPASSTNGNAAVFSGTTGKAIADSGKALPSGVIVGTTDTQTLTNKTLTAPVINSPTGLVKADVGLGNVDNVPVLGEQALFIPAAAMITRTTAGAATFSTELPTNDVMIRGFDFDASTAEAVQLFLALPKQWDEGPLAFRFYWTAASGSGGVAFSMRARAASDDDAMDGTWGTAITVTDTFIAANDMHVSARSSPVTIGGSPAEGDMIFIEITREVANGADTLAVDARLLGVEIYINTNAARDN